MSAMRRHRPYSLSSLNQHVSPATTAWSAGGFLSSKENPRRVRAPGTPHARKEHEGAPVALQGLKRGAARGVDRIERGEHDGAMCTPTMRFDSPVRFSSSIRSARLRFTSARQTSEWLDIHGQQLFGIGLSRK